MVQVDAPSHTLLSVSSANCSQCSEAVETSKLLDLVAELRCAPPWHEASDDAPYCEVDTSVAVGTEAGAVKTCAAAKPFNSAWEHRVG